jgi:hypothetical protein
VLKTILQIVPRVPGGIDGVGDYALTVARKLREKFNLETVFAIPITAFVLPPGWSSPSVEGFDLVALEHLLKPPSREFDEPEFDDVLLHYVNYGYQKRGIPFGLLSILRQIRQQRGDRLVTIFHELYASGPPWRSEFWLKPIQIHLTKSVAGLSDECLVSSENFLRELRRLVPEARVHLHPVPSGLEEPLLSREQIADRDPHRWGILGGTVLAERSVRSFRENLRRLPDSVSPRTVVVIGGHDNPATRSFLADLGVESVYHPEIAASDASEILRTCSFAWFDYFRRHDVEFSMILKSSAYAAACAHAIIPVFPHRGSPISIKGDRLPGPFFVESNGREVPTAAERPKIAANIYEWYQRHASSDSLVSGVAKVFGLNQNK